MICKVFTYVLNGIDISLFELKLVCNSRSRTIIKKSITQSDPHLIIEDFNSLRYMLDLKGNSFTLLEGEEIGGGFTNI